MNDLMRKPRRRRAFGIVLCGIVAVCLAARYLYDPPWVSGVTSGMRDWEVDQSGARFRWTSGHASFFVPSSASEMTVPFRAVFPSPDGRPVVLKLAVDDRSIATIELRNQSEWARPILRLPRQTGSRRYRRVDVRVSRVVGFYNLGVEIGEMTFR